MYLVFNTGGESFSISVESSQKFNTLLEDPFFGAQLPDLEIKIGNRLEGHKLPVERKKLLQDNTLSHFPFFLTSYLGFILSQKGYQLIHGASFIVDKCLYILLGGMGIGKSTMLYTILSRKLPNIIGLCDDKIVLDMTGGYFVSGNKNLSLRGLTRDKNVIKSKFTQKQYMILRKKQSKYPFDCIKFIKLNNVHNYTPGEMSKRELILYLYHNILDIISGNQACSLDPIMTYDIPINKEEKDTLLNILSTYIYSSKCNAYECGEKDIDFILSLIH